MPDLVYCYHFVFSVYSTVLYLDRLIVQLPRSFLIMGDLNGHNLLWGSMDINAKGKILKDLLHHLSICNDG